MLPLRARAMHRDDEVDLFADANPQLLRAQLLPQAQVDDPSSPRGPSRPPQAKQIVPRRILPHPDTSYPLIRPTTRLFAWHIQNASKTLLESRIPVVPTVLVVSTSVPRRETLGSPLAHPRPPSNLVPSLRSCAYPRLRLAVWANRRTSPPLRRVLQPLRESELYIDGMETESEAQSLNALPPPNAIWRRVIVFERA